MWSARGWVSGNKLRHPTKDLLDIEGAAEGCKAISGQIFCGQVWLCVARHQSLQSLTPESAAARFFEYALQACPCYCSLRRFTGVHPWLHTRQCHRDNERLRRGSQPSVIVQNGSGAYTLNASLKICFTTNGKLRRSAYPRQKCRIKSNLRSNLTARGPLKWKSLDITTTSSVPAGTR